MRAVEFASRWEAEASKRDDEVVVVVYAADGPRFGVLPAEVTVGERSQPIHEFLGGYFGLVEAEARRKVGGK